ncbi:hypothetical protein EVAR_32459_1 [Eumeta japonica]|uniref:Uncharacterized protein n=1 Tax=Eumeta variegata TaxID=151549 RepID=A0A4C1VP27_EUMVA|nr:hypothetical protein EVAR_32459_1 [Eumeta japonica]
MRPTAGASWRRAQGRPEDLNSKGRINKAHLSEAFHLKNGKSKIVIVLHHRKNMYLALTLLLEMAHHWRINTTLSLSNCNKRLWKSKITFNERNRRFILFFEIGRDLVAQTHVIRVDPFADRLEVADPVTSPKVKQPSGRAGGPARPAAELRLLHFRKSRRERRPSRRAYEIRRTRTSEFSERDRTRSQKIRLTDLRRCSKRQCSPTRNISRLVQCSDSYRHGSGVS